LDLRDFNTAGPYVEEIRRIAAECRDRRAQKAAATPTIVPLGLLTKNGTANGDLAAFSPEQLLAPAGRRWYPVIDYSRCTNCLECLDFCLFGVYGVDAQDRIITENQDQCKKGCPACSRVCPEQAIIFPEYKSAAIAGADTGAVGGLKIDLSKLFGGDVADALSTAVAERDRELLADGREAVGMSVGIPKRQANKPQGPKDDLDKLVDDLDSLGL
jgi:NAD-dependent dihydropyrimidine dehydrogenase PreA subunit